MDERNSVLIFYDVIKAITFKQFLGYRSNERHV